jgi:hypothetical protein
MCRASTRALVVLTAAVLAAACAGGRTVVPVSMEAARLRVPQRAQELTTHEQAVRGVAAILGGDLKLPVPEQVTLYVYASRRIFEDGLVRDGQVSRLRAAELSDFAAGIGKRRQLLLHHDGAVSSADWLRLLSHELTHVTQIELARGEGRAEQWLAEGMAEWAAFHVLERLRLDTLRRRRVAASQGVRQHPALMAGRLDLETLGSPRGFTTRHLGDGSQLTYQLAFLLADQLIQRHGFEALVGYFRSCGVRADRRENFTAAFGQSVTEFEQEALAHLAIAVR